MSKKIQRCIGAFFVVTLGSFAVAGCGGGGSHDIVIERGLGITPTTTVVAPGRSETLHASFLEGAPDKAPVVWKVREGDAGGTVTVEHDIYDSYDGTVTYTAPMTPGTYHVEVSGVYGQTTKTGTADVKVDNE